MIVFDRIYLVENNLITPGLKPKGDVRVDLSLPITEGMTGCFLFQERAPFKNMILDMPDIVSTTGYIPTLQGGDVFLDDDIDAGLTISNRALGGVQSFDATDFTFFFIIDTRKSPVSSNDQILVGSTDIGTADLPIYFDNVGADGRLTTFSSGNKSWISTQEPNYNAGVFESYANSYNTTSNDGTLYLNGGIVAGGHQQSFTRTYARSFSGDVFHVFSNPPDAGEDRRLVARLKCFYIFTRVLGNHEIAQLHADPFGFIIPA